MCNGVGQVDPVNSIAPAAAVLQAIGGLVAGNAAKNAGEATRNADYFKAEQLTQNAGNVVAAGQRTAAEQRLQADLMVSRAIAVAGASGGDVSSPGVTKIITDIAGRGAYNAAMSMYNAEDEARTMRLQAEGERYSGDIAASGGREKQAAYQFGTAGAMATASSLFSKYGNGGPKSGQTGKGSISSDWDFH